MLEVGVYHGFSAMVWPHAVGPWGTGGVGVQLRLRDAGFWLQTTLCGRSSCTPPPPPRCLFCLTEKQKDPNAPCRQAEDGTPTIFQLLARR